MNALVLPQKWLSSTIRIAVVGAGGTGSQVIDQLASLDSVMRALGHPGFQVELHDPDTVSRWNLGRQRFAAPDVGLRKCDVLIHRINLFYGVGYEAVPKYFDAANAARFDLLITCTDSAKFRAEVGARHRGRPCESLWADAGNGDAMAQCVIGHLGVPEAGLRVPNVYDLFPQLAYMQEQDTLPSCSMQEALTRQPWPANRTVAIALTTLLERLLRTGALSTHGCTIQLDPYTVTPMPVDPVAWAMYGYPPAPQRKRRKAAA